MKMKTGFLIFQLALSHEARKLVASRGGEAVERNISPKIKQEKFNQKLINNVLLISFMRAA